MPQVVASYRGFATRVARWWHHNVERDGVLLIGIDEVDRIVNADIAEHFLNEIKAIFGVERCVYVVSVSEEALASFERRIVRVRTAFDSAFDDIVRLRPLAAHESVELLRRRLAGVPDTFLLLCHCVAGGMPRDIIRAARTMLDIHREQPGSTTLVEVCQQLITYEIASVKRGFLSAIREDSVGVGLVAKASMRDGWPGPSSAEIVGAMMEIDAIAVQDGDLERPESALRAALYFYATILDVFSMRPDIVTSWANAVRRPSMVKDMPDRLRVVHESGLPVKEQERWLELVGEVQPRTRGTVGKLEVLSDVHRLLSSSPAAAVAMLSTLRAELDLEVPMGLLQT